jgi:choline-sulfatase
MAGPGESPYTFYDKEICSRAQVWLREQACKAQDKPWVLFVSFVAPHFPLTAPPEHYYRYWNRELPMPLLYAREQRPKHPYLEDYRNSFCYDDYFESEADVQARAVRLLRAGELPRRERGQGAARARGPACPRTRA